ncbi:unnamed protein product [Phaedon cochleariae]|uniref:Uncharacterized protein n=1 Tax=Phaedon cochleariae TaxID=80249 RepID=A0A9N9X1V9_PHACE|nr:unnamed protein product [Phaedon cochleariae]
MLNHPQHGYKFLMDDLIKSFTDRGENLYEKWPQFRSAVLNMMQEEKMKPIFDDIESDGQPNTGGGEEIVEQTMLQDDILSILGSDNSTRRSFSDTIQVEIANRWSHILASGLEEATQTALTEKYFPPENCPLLNPLVKVAISDSVILRGGRLVALQQQMAASMTAIGSVLTK